MLTRSKRKQMEKEKNAMPSDRASKRTREQRESKKMKATLPLLKPSTYERGKQIETVAQTVQESKKMKAALPLLKPSMYERGKQIETVAQTVEKCIKPKEEKANHAVVSYQARSVKIFEESPSRRSLKQRVEPAELKQTDFNDILDNITRFVEIWDTVKHKYFEKYNIDPSTLVYPCPQAALKKQEALKKREEALKKQEEALKPEEALKKREEAFKKQMEALKKNKSYLSHIVQSL